MIGTPVKPIQTQRTARRCSKSQLAELVREASVQAAARQLDDAETLAASGGAAMAREPGPLRAQLPIYTIGLYLPPLSDR